MSVGRRPSIVFSIAASRMAGTQSPIYQDPRFPPDHDPADVAAKS
jgi:hypothetical protein